MQPQKRQIFSRHVFSPFLAEGVAKNKPFLCASFCRILRCRAKFRPKTHTCSLKNAKFSRARLRRALAACTFIFFGRGRGQKQALLCASFCRILRCRAKFRPKTHTCSLKNAKFLARARGLYFYLLWPGARQKQVLFVCVILPHFAIRNEI